jgi:ubiquinone/menaquinone biosynthesis C-methylase UbiE
MSFKGGKKSNVFNSEIGYDMYANCYDKSLSYLNSFEKDHVLRVLGDLNGKKVLDIGCGTGRLIPELKKRGAEIVACDLSDEMLSITKKKYPDIETYKANILELPFNDNEFDLVIAMFVIVHIRDLTPAFDEVYRVLKNKGSFLLSNINQRKSPKLKIDNGDEIVIQSHYHMPKHVTKALEESFFTIQRDEFVYEEEVWINQIIKAVK